MTVPTAILRCLLRPILKKKSPLLAMAGRIMAPEDDHILILGICECVSLYGKRSFADRIELRVLRLENGPGLFRWA